MMGHYTIRAGRIRPYRCPANKACYRDRGWGGLTSPRADPDGPTGGTFLCPNTEEQHDDLPASS